MSARRWMLAGMLAGPGLVACDLEGDKSGGYDEGCTDGTDIGYVNGLIAGEGCQGYDDTPDDRAADTGDEYTASYNEGYADCYPDAYSQGYDEGSTSAECR